MITIERAQVTEQTVLRNLMQLYIYDFSEMIALEVTADGTFADRPLDSYWNDQRRIPYLVRNCGHLAGFALVHQGSRLTGESEVWDMAEFFVLRKHRRAGVGCAAARLVFAAHPGLWEVRQRIENVAAIAFWRRAIVGPFAETLHDDAHWRGPVQRFTVP